MSRTNSIDLICEHINKNIEKDIYLFLDIDDVVIINYNKFNEKILKIYELIDINKIFYLTARDPEIYRHYTYKELNTNIKNTNMKNIIFAPNEFGKSKKGPKLLKYIEENNINLNSDSHIIFIDDLCTNIFSVIDSINKSELECTYMTFQYVKEM